MDSDDRYDQLARSLFVYDYSYKLKKIISLDVPIVRVATNCNSNELVMVNYNNGEFNLSKMNL